jgi:hypothetical protein
MRTIKIFYQQSGKTESVKSAAKNKGELVAEVSALEDKKLIIRETKLTLELNESALPEGNFTLFVFPNKSKAGAGLGKYTVKQVEDMLGNNLRRTVRKLADAGALPKYILKLDTEGQRAEFIYKLGGVTKTPASKPAKAVKPVKAHKIAKVTGSLENGKSDDKLKGEANDIAAQLDNY